MTYLLYMLKGVVIGIANVIPGVSGATLAIVVNIYDKLLEAVNNLFKSFKSSVKTLLPIFIGAAIGIVGLSFAIEFLFARFPIQTNFAFIGLILGGLPLIFKKIKGENFNWKCFLSCFIFFALIAGLSLVGETSGSNADLTINVINIAKLLGVGIIASATMIIPGVSGSMILILMGYYHPIIETINLFIKSLLAFDGTGLLNSIAVLAPFGIGVVIGIFALAKIIGFIMKKFPILTYWAIIGLIAASPVAILLTADLSGFNLISAITGVLFLGVGFITAKFLGEK